MITRLKRHPTLNASKHFLQETSSRDVFQPSFFCSFSAFLLLNPDRFRSFRYASDALLIARIELQEEAPSFIAKKAVAGFLQPSSCFFVH